MSRASCQIGIAATLYGFLAACLLASPFGANRARAEIVSASSDVTIALGESFTVVAADEDVGIDSGIPDFFLLENIGSLPDEADVTAYAQNADGDRYLAFDTTLALPSGPVVRPGDVVRFDGAGYSMAFDASAEGVPVGVTTDAVSLAPSGLLLSFDTTVDLAGLIVEDEDLVRWNGSGFSLVFDGSVEGLDRSLDVDAAQDLGGGAFLVSFDTTGLVGGVVFQDEDVLRFEGGTWSLEYDASSVDTDWEAADLDGLLVPEPSWAALMAAGTLWIGLAGARRQAR